MAFIFPTHIFNPAEIKSSRSRRVASGGVSISGVEDVIQVDGGGAWSWTLSGINLRNPEMLRRWDAWDSYLGGGTVECWLPVASVSTAPRPLAGGRLMRPGDLYTDDPLFPTVVRYASPYIVASFTAPAVLRATIVSLVVNQGARVLGGEKFSVMSLKGPRLYGISRVISQDGQNATVEVWPPLREQVVSGQSINFEWPMMRARLQAAYDMSGSITHGKYSSVEAVFVEVTN